MQGGDQEPADAFLFPAIQPFRTGMLEVSPVHTLYYEECGHPTGTVRFCRVRGLYRVIHRLRSLQPVIILHGGPGSGCSEDMRRFHDPQHYRIILLDQRGAGRSTPFASLVDNTYACASWLLLWTLRG
jgi:proline iminopeptidase